MMLVQNNDKNRRKGRVRINLLLEGLQGRGHLMMANIFENLPIWYSKQ